MSICKFINKPIKIFTDYGDKVLEIQNKVGNHRNIVFSEYHGDLNQQWIIKYHDCGEISIRSYTDQNLVLDVCAARTDQGSHLISYEENNPIGKNQKWKIVETRGCDGFILEPLHCPGKVLDCHASKSNACIWTKHGGSNQVMRFEIVKFTKLKTIYEKDIGMFRSSMKVGDSTISGIEWKSPLQINSNAVFIDNDFVFDDVDQGQLGNCWFLAALQSILEESPHKLNGCIPKNVNFRSANYNGVLEFVFYDNGLPTKVVISDKLPTVKGSLIFASSNRSNEFWTPLIEKAYAVFQGDYDEIHGGYTSDGLEDLANMVSQYKELKSITDEQLKHYVRSGIAFCASSNSGSDTNSIEGIVQGHAYAVKDVVTLPNGINLIQLINPWGEFEFDGDWSNKSEKWNAYPHMKPADDDDGVFHMAFGDFRRHFRAISYAFN